METSPDKDPVVLGVDGKPINKRFQQNMFELEDVVTEKQKMRNDLIDNREKMKEVIKNMTPIELFILFDEDDSGLISFPEFKNMLPFLDINITDAKAFRYFKLCDTDGSGEIDIDEFQVALFACDPNSGNAVGYQPSRNLTPMDAFDIFDENQTGFLDEDSFRYAVEYLRLGVTDEQLENLFLKYDVNNTGHVDYVEFREIFLQTCNLRKELEDREIDTPTFIRKKTLRAMLREVLLDEEMRERKALAEARRYKKWVLNVRDSKRLLQKGEFRAYQELRSALDAAGQVYVIGTGTYNQFGNNPGEVLRTKQFEFQFFDRLVELWRDRVQPEQLVDRLRAQRKAEEHEQERDAERNLSGIGQMAKSAEKSRNKIDIDPYKEALDSNFRGLKVALNTVSLWGRRIHQVAISESVLFALADTGEVYALGGNSFWWHEIQPDSVYQHKWRGDTTARSQLLLGTTDKALPPDASLTQDFDALSPDDKLAETIKIVAKYYNVWEPPPNPAQRMRYLKKEMMSLLSYEGLKFSLKVRGKKLGDVTKMHMVELLHADVMLEKKLLGERTHKAIREIETQVASLLKRKKTKLANKFLQRIDEMWAPLREVQAEQRAAEITKNVASEHALQTKKAENYRDWRLRVADKREDMVGEQTPRGNGMKIDLIGVTPRGPEMVTPRGYQSALQITSGAAHAGLIHKSGQLYMWGVGASGRLGLDLTEFGDPQRDVAKPKLVQALSEMPVVRVSCGFSHTGAIVAGGDLYMWGSTVAGKCGLGPVVEHEECYCSIPTRVIVGMEDRRVKKLSCGASHSAIVTEAGLLYVFGCGDTGRLGMGRGVYATMYEPSLVQHLLHERIASVSCGNTTTIVSTEVSREWVGDIDEKARSKVGGRVYVAGSLNALGTQCDRFTLVTELDGIAVKQVSAGYLHQAVVTVEGELYCWGSNKNGCCGISTSRHFIQSPEPAKFLYTCPSNIALHKLAYQSTTFNGREAINVTNGRKEGLGVNKCSCTQQEGQPWLEIDLGQMALISHIVLWNRTDVPSDRTQPVDLYTSRLFPCWVMLGREPFQKAANTLALKENIRKAVCKVKFTEDRRSSIWRCPANVQGRYVRVQLERYNMLSIAEVEVYGYWTLTQGVGRVSFATAGRDVTVAVVRPSTDPADVENLYSRAAYSDAANADILRQLETYALEFDKFGRGEVLKKKCPICGGNDSCEACMVYETFDADIEKMPPVIGGRRRRLKSISEFLINSNKPPLEPIVVPRCQRPTKWQAFYDNYLEQIDITKFFTTRGRQTYITPEEALAVNPDDMIKKITYTSKVDQTSRNNINNTSNKTVSTGVGSHSLDSQSNSNTKQSKSTKTNDNSTVDTAESNSMTTDIIKHGYGANKPMQEGDYLPTGHKIKPAYPKSFAAQLDESTNAGSGSFSGSKKKRKK